MSKYLITRSDDCGSNIAANIAIEKAVSAGFIKNVSIMGCADFVEDAAERLKDCKQVCFGMHGTMNAEWDTLKWKPRMPKNEVPSLLDEKGELYQDPSLFKAKQPHVEEVIKELNAQLDYLTKCRFDISYVDSHMLWEENIDGMREEMTDWIAAKGLISDHEIQTSRIQGRYCGINLKQFEDSVERWNEGIYFFVGHPAYPLEEMYLLGNKGCLNTQIVGERNGDMLFATNPKVLKICEKYNIIPIRYDKVK